jgi:hypothetical protein
VKTLIFRAADLFVRFLQCEKSPPRDLPIAVGESWPVGKERILFYNCEQLTRTGACRATVLHRATKADVAEVWDYSQVNVDIWKEHGITARLVPLQTPDDYIQMLRNFRSSLPIQWDVGFCGYISGNHRPPILAALAAAGLSVRIIRKTGIERDKELAQCHVLVNIHYNPTYKVWESHRCQAWIDIGVPIVSEHSLDDNPGCVNVPYECLVEETVRQVSIAKGAINSSH